MSAKCKGNKWFEDEFSGALYLHDASSASFYSYCYAYELQNLAEKGLYFLPITNGCPPQHMTTFFAHLREFIAWVSCRSAGACALPSFFIYSFYFWKKDVENGYYLVTKEFLIRENELAKRAATTPNCRQKCAACGANKAGEGVCFEKCKTVL